MAVRSAKVLLLLLIVAGVLVITEDFSVFNEQNK